MILTHTHRWPYCSERESRLCRQSLPSRPDSPDTPPNPSNPDTAPERRAFPGVYPAIQHQLNAVGQHTNVIRQQAQKLIYQGFVQFAKRWEVLRRSSNPPSPARLQQMLGAANQELQRLAQRGYPLNRIVADQQGRLSLHPVNTSGSGPNVLPGIDVRTLVNMFMNNPNMNPLALQQTLSEMYRKGVEGMPADHRRIFQQTIIGVLELQGFQTPRNFDNVIAMTEPLIPSTGQMRGLTQIMGAVRFVGIGLQALRLSMTPQQREALNVADRLRQYNTNSRRLIDLQFTQNGGNITELRMSPRSRDDINPAGTTDADRIEPMDFADFRHRLVAQGLREGTEFTVSGTTIRFNTPSEATMNTVLRVLQSLVPERGTTPEETPSGPLDRINTYASNNRRQVNVERTPDSGNTVTRLRLTPRTDGLDADDRIDADDIYDALQSEGVPTDALDLDGNTVDVRDDGLNETNLPKVAEVLEELMVSADGGAPETSPDSTTEYTNGINAVRTIRNIEINGLVFLERVHGAETVGGGIRTITQHGQTLRFRFHQGKWQFEASGGTWKEINGEDGNTVVAADVGGVDAAVTVFNDTILATLQRINNGEAAVFTEMETTDRVGFRGHNYVIEMHDATRIPEGYRITKEGKDLRFRFHQGNWQFEANGGTWKEIDGTNTVDAADVGGSALSATKFNTEVLPTLLRLNNREDAVFTQIENIEYSNNRGGFYLQDIHDATLTVDGYQVAKEGNNLDFRFHHGKWQFEASGGTWKEIDGTNTVDAADVGGSALSATKFNTEVLPTLLRLNNREDAVFTQMENIEQSLTNGQYYLTEVHDATSIAVGYRITKEGKHLYIRFEQDKWEFRADGGTWKEINATNTVAAADVDGSADAANAFNTSVLPTLRD